VHERGSAAGLTGHEGDVDDGEREARELVGGRAVWIVAERGVAFFAHVGGFIFGLLAAPLLARAGQAPPREQWRSTA
jgi:hypothetical protein